MIDLSNESVIHIKGKEIEYLQFRRLLDYPEIVHCYTLSENGFNVAGNDTYADKKEIVFENYKKLSTELNVDYNNILRPYQIHSDTISCVEEKIDNIEIFPKRYQNVDGLLTNKIDIVFSLTFADCIPIFLYDPVKKVIGNIHSGWKGTLKKIGKKAVEKMIMNYGCNPKDIICCIGPSIRKDHFEVSEDVYNMFYNEFKYTNQINDFILNCDNGKYHIDTVLINMIMIKEVGIKEENIIDSNICTVCNSELMHSYRKNGEHAGRNTAIIGMRK